MSTIEERKLVLEEQRLELEKASLQIKQKESMELQAKRVRIDPVLATIIIAIIGFIATAFGTIINNAHNNDLEQRKFESDLIKTALNEHTQDDKIKALRLLITLRLIHGETLSGALNDFLKDTAAAKRALTGNPNIPRSDEARKIFFEEYKKAFGTLSDSQSGALIKLFDFIRTDSTLKHYRVVAYVLAIIQHETMGSYIPVRGIGPDSWYEKTYGPQTTIGSKIGNIAPGDGSKYRPRGYLTIEGRGNYQRYNAALGLEGTADDIVANPEKVMEPILAYRLCSIMMADTDYPGHKLSSYLNADSADYLHAAEYLYGHNGPHTARVAAAAQRFETILQASILHDK